MKKLGWKGKGDHKEACSCYTLAFSFRVYLSLARTVYVVGKSNILTGHNVTLNGMYIFLVKIRIKLRACVLTCVQLFVTTWTPLSSLTRLCLWDSPGKNTGMVCHFLLQEIFPTQGSNLSLLLGRQILYLWATCEAHISGYQVWNL